MTVKQLTRDQLNDLAQAMLSRDKTATDLVAEFVNGGVEITTVLSQTIQTVVGLIRALPEPHRDAVDSRLQHTAQGIHIDDARAARLVIALFDGNHAAVNEVYMAVPDGEKDAMFAAVLDLPYSIMRGMPSGMISFTVGGQS
jgi:hypothetical protein